MKVFHRYHSDIHGNYRKAYLRCGLLTGALLSFLVLGRYLMRATIGSPVSLLTDAVLLVAIFLFAAYYRNSLPEKRVTLKELMLFGTGLALIAAVVYAISLWCMMLLDGELTTSFVMNMTGQTTSPADPQIGYWAAFLAILTALEVIVLGAFGAFLAAILFRNEKSQVITKSKN